MALSVFFVLVLAIFLGFFIQTVVGFAGALVALPMLLIVMNLQDAIAYLALFYLYSSSILVVKEWKNIDKLVLLKLTVATIIGVALGIWILQYGKPLVLKKMLGLFILLYVIFNMFVVKKTSGKKNRFSFVFGLAGGFFSGLFSTGGPLYVMVVKNTVVDMRTFRATMIGVLGLITITRVPILYAQNILTYNHFYNSLYIIPSFLLATFLGKSLYNKLNEIVLKNMVLGLLLISGLVMLIKN
ncbi:permease [Tenacibaculum sp. SZ-18]|nr:sulfite exporter TauE/SafE family protein [Tenacibaculum sp. SZ-18]AUC16854.1 permease [Tenacibaculum sp. SZ-18]